VAEVLEGPGQGQVVGLRGRGQDVVHPLGSLYRGTAGGGSQRDGSHTGGDGGLWRKGRRRASGDVGKDSCFGVY